MSRLERARRLLEGRYRASLAQEAADLAGLGNDWARVRSAVHRIKGSGGSFGFPTISAAALAVETAAESERSCAVAKLIDELVRNYVPADSETAELV